MTPTATVCVSTYNRASRLAALLQSLAEQDVQGFDVVVLDDGSTDATASVLEQWRHRLPLTVLRAERNAGPAHGRNQAWRAARGSVVLFTDDDCRPAPGWVRAHLAAHGPRTVTVGRTEAEPDRVGGPFSRTVQVHDARFFQTCNAGYPRGLLVELGGFDERFRRAAGEDTDLGLRAVAAGADAAFVADALVHHEVRPSSWRAAAREATKWVDLPLVVAKHPVEAGRLLHRGIWWRRSHPLALLALAGLCLTPTKPAAVVATLPWLRLRALADPVPGPRRDWPAVLPGQLAIDLLEVGALVRGSVRHRKLLL
jgi:glycosyltransferase involved in cell wall biosynthesis